MSNVVSLKDGALLGALAPDPDIVARLEALLEEAKAGEVKTLLYVVIRPCENIKHGYVGCHSRHLCVAGAAYLAEMVTRDALEGDDE